MPDYSAFSKNLNRILKDRCIAQSKLAAKSRVSQSSIAGYCRGSHYPSINIVQDIAEALGVDVSELLKKEP